MKTEARTPPSPHPPPPQRALRCSALRLAQASPRESCRDNVTANVTAGPPQCSSGAQHPPPPRGPRCVQGACVAQWVSPRWLGVSSERQQKPLVLHVSAPRPRPGEPPPGPQLGGKVHPPEMLATKNRCQGSSPQIPVPRKRHSSRRVDTQWLVVSMAA